MKKYAQWYETQWGWGAVCYSPKGITEIFLPTPFREELWEDFFYEGIEISSKKERHPAITQLMEYFAGNRS